MKNNKDLLNKINEKYSMGKIRDSEEYGYIDVGPLGRYTVISKQVYMLFHGMQSMLVKPDNTWYHPDSNKYPNDAIILSDGNSKVCEAAEKLGFINPKINPNNKVQKHGLAYGKPSIIACPFASNCVKFCYADEVESKYVGSLRIHAHNYKIVYGAKTQAIYNAIVNGYARLNSEYKLIRLNDTADFISKFEILAWAMFARENPGLTIYGYTKNTPHLYMARKEFGQFPSNFRISISDTNENDGTMEKYMRQIRSEFDGEFKVCHILDTFERIELFKDLPFNNTETQAIEYTSDFTIGLHLIASQKPNVSDEEWMVHEYFETLQKTLDVEVC